MGMKKWENFLGDRIEGFFNKRFASNLEPVELVDKLKKTMDKEKKKVQGELLAPNDYRFIMAEPDYQRLKAKRVMDLLYNVAEKEAIRKNLFIDGKLDIHFFKEKERKLGFLTVNACFSGSPDCKDAGDDHTIVVEKKSIMESESVEPKENIAAIKVVEGADVNSYLEFSNKAIYIGRQERNDFILSDGSASRTHAYISYERHRHVLHDVDSLNGTFLNGSRITESVLSAGDEIAIGNTVMVYEVI